ncbi:MAG: bifunctional hydroxymethylpyrimidine kinase/phosphomethylpyrimidine kinase, partial [Lachnospiraceae bacterium]|nr:bifunctional hydroxymethylpyrimidine kinase/phosphomethylpyrimidine kinase [Lachnospiraceae bacterium]
VKIGMLSSAECMRAVAAKMQQYHPRHIVVDPVMYAKNGCPLMDKSAIHTLVRQIIPIADILTPNIPEAEEIAGMQIATVEEMKTAAHKIYDMGCKSVVVKGGHFTGNAIDILYDGSRFYDFASERIATKNTHGTGCTFSSAIAAQLAQGASTPKAVSKAKAYVTTAIAHSLSIGKGYGPTHHFYRLYQHGLQGMEEGCV